MEIGPSNTHSRLVAVLVASVFLSCVSASEGRRMREDLEMLDARIFEMTSSLSTERHRLNELIIQAETEVSSLENALAEAREVLQRSNANLGGSVDALEGDIQGLRDQLERVHFTVEQLQEQFNLLMEEVLFNAAPQAIPDDSGF